jgi:histidinol-phosphate aminotransferase
VVPAQSNFVMVVFAEADQAARVVDDLLTQGVIVRPLKAFGLPQCIRISTGTDQDNERCVAAMQKAVLSTGVVE